VYAVEALASTGGTLFTIGIFFYTKDRFGWALAENFRLAATQGVIYVVGALLAHRVAGRVSHGRALPWLQLVMALACGAGAGMATAKAGVVAVLLGYTFVSAVTWPILESLAVVGTAGPRMARRLAVYNVVWPAVGAATVAASGWVIQTMPTGMFLIPAAAHALAVGLSLLATPRPPTRRSKSGGAAGDALPSSHPARASSPAHPEPEPELLRVRTVALWVSRLGLPATYAVIYGLMPLMPSLPAVRSLSTAEQTVVCSAWLVARWLTFVALAAHPWWHTRPRAMVAAAVLMLVAFLGITVAPSQVLGGDGWAGADLAAVVGWQLVLGVALGVIYSGSLYFGMVLSEGSTEHSGYHEALVGLGWVLGPLAGVMAQAARPGDVAWGVAAVGSVIALSVACVVGASVAARARMKAEG
jgi:hypothetical protein